MKRQIARWLGAGLGAVLVAGLPGVGLTGVAGASEVSLQRRVAMSDGVTLHATLAGRAPLSARPLIVEFSPYGPGPTTFLAGPAYNRLLVQIRGTGDSDGHFDALGPRSQADVAETLRWACGQPWSDGRLALSGFSASAIIVYNALNRRLPCVRAAVLKSGTFELYRDLLWPGGISNALPGAGVLGLIGAPALEQGPARLGRAPATGLDTLIGLTAAGLQGGLLHPSLDSFWRRRGFRGDVNHLPILMIDSFFDVESRGAFAAFGRLRRDGARLLVVAGHDGAPTATDSGAAAASSWLDHYLRGGPGPAASQPTVSLLLSDGSREGYLHGAFVRRDAGGWPVPGTRWRSLWLAPTPGLGALEGSLLDTRPASGATRSYAAIASNPSMTDVPNTAIVGAAGANAFADAFPALTETNLAEPAALSFSTAPLRSDVLSAGPAALELTLSSTAPESDVWAVIADVWPDGSSHPLAVGRLRTSYPNLVAGRSLLDRAGDVVEPYGDYSHKSYAPPGRERRYHVEFWPIGNRFAAGHRIRLVLTGASAASSPAAPALDTVRLGGPNGARLLLPVLP